jgi:hypothetical protein
MSHIYTKKTFEIGCINHYTQYTTHKFFILTLWLFNIAMEAMDNRNRWFTYSMVNLSSSLC